MIDIEALASIRTIITHRRTRSLCADAVAASLIVRDVLPDVVVHFVEYGEELENVAPRPGCLFLDIAPTLKNAQAHADAGAIVLDHHDTAKDVVAMFGPRGVYADAKSDPGVSAAFLAFATVWRPLAFRNGQRPRMHSVEGRAENDIAWFARLAGIADTFQKNSRHWEEAVTQAAALSFWNWSDYPHPAFRMSGYSDELHERLSVGLILRRKQRDAALSAIQLGIRRTTPLGTKVLIVPTRDTTDIGEIAGADFDIIIGFEFGQTKTGLPLMTVSTRSQGRFNCGAFCQHHGGGGHENAAGFPLVLHDHTTHPFAYLFERLCMFESMTQPEAP